MSSTSEASGESGCGCTLEVRTADGSVIRLDGMLEAAVVHKDVEVYDQVHEPTRSYQLDKEFKVVTCNRPFKLIVNQGGQNVEITSRRVHKNRPLHEFSA